jgi:hypothetical protein
MLAQQVEVAPHANPPRIMRDVNTKSFLRSAVEKNIGSSAGQNPPSTRNHPESLGTCLPHPATRIFLWPRWQARAPWISCGQPVRQDCICENRSVGSGRSPLVDHRGQSCGRTVAGSELNLLVLIVLVFFDLDAQRLQKFHVLIVHLKIRIRGHRGH